ncbi:MAG: SURF1 family protein [Gemmatimonadetes bacterium]|nr:SURF1 family protein [Gemmatimonadota bacterium]
MKKIQVTRAGWIGAAIALLAAAVFVRLGVWQVDRLAERRAQNAAIAARLALPPLRLERAPGDSSALSYRRVVVAGVYDDERTLVLAGRSYRGSPGAHVITPLRLADGTTVVLVNRGWAPAPDGATVDLPHLREPGPVRLSGLLLPLSRQQRGPAAGARRPGAPAFQRVWVRLEPAAVRRQYPSAIRDVYIQALAEPGHQGLPLRLEPPALDNGPHLSYAIQWFSFALITLIGSAALAVRSGEVRWA